MSDNYAEVAPAVPLPATGKQTYTYLLPNESENLINRRVNVPLGPRFVNGVIVKTHNKKPSFAVKKLKLKDEWLTSQQVELATWIAKNAHGGLGFTLRMFIGLPENTVAAPSQEKCTPLQFSIIEKDSAKRANQIKKLARIAQKNKRQTLILVPEKNLLDNFASFAEGVSGDLSAKQVKEVSKKTAQDSKIIVAGTQKALFLPYCNLGLVVVDEDFYSTHKLWDQYPRLDNHPAADYLAMIFKAPQVFSGSVMSLKAFAETPPASGHLPLSGEESLRPLLDKGGVRGGFVTWRDKPQELNLKMVQASANDRRERSPVPQEALRLITKWVSKKDRVFVLYNRHDDRVAAIKSAIKTQLTKAEEKRVIVDTEIAIRELQIEKADRVIWLNPERSLSYPDYRSQEQAISLLVRLQQLLPKRRNVYLVTRVPRLIKEKMMKPVEDIYQDILKERKRHHYPPFHDVARLTVTEKTKKKAMNRAVKIAQAIIEKDNDKIKVKGPYFGFNASQKDKGASAHVLLSGPLESLPEAYKDIKIDTVDVNPSQIL